MSVSQVFSQLADPGQLGGAAAATRGARNVVLGHVAPEALREGLQAMGAGLSDREFRYLLDAAPGARQADGTLSLVALDQALHAESARRDAALARQRAEAVAAHPRYSRTYQVHIQPTRHYSRGANLFCAARGAPCRACHCSLRCHRSPHNPCQQPTHFCPPPSLPPLFRKVHAAVSSHVEPEHAPMAAGALGRGDGLRWGKLQGRLQEACAHLPRYAEEGSDTRRC